uniref:Caspase domain-containing protein n=1 Tax=Candidatus Kentrum sp. TUN TaxID=2126343 RepID=A0A450ZNI9_9GAMM|nr:MAG: Caspase domain-containing protein [Candidatus Kentron sp. TUN]
MNKAAIIYIFLLLGLFYLPVSAVADRGVVRVRISEGQELELYKRRSYALLIGVSDYDTGWNDLTQVPKELDQVGRMLARQGFAITRVDNPNDEELVRALRDFKNKYGFDEKNRLLFFFSGHGYTRDNGKGYLVPRNAPDPRKNERWFLRKAFPMSSILSIARAIEVRHALFLFDSCFSGTVFQARNLPAIPSYITRLVSRKVRQFITAGSAGEHVPAKSTFVPAFVDGISYGNADLNGDGYVTGMELGLYLQNEVPRYVSQTPQFGKIKDYKLSRGDFVFVLRSGVEKLSLEQEKQLPTMETRQPSEQWIKQKVQKSAKAQDSLMGFVEIIFWNTVQSNNSADMYRIYLERYPSGHFAPLASVMVEQLKPKTGNITKKHDVDFGSYHTLIIGNNKYKYLSPLKNAQRDAEELSNLLEGEYGFKVIRLSDATRGEIITELGRFRRTLKNSDNLLIYYAGHGWLDESADEGYWLPIDAAKDNDTNWISNNKITNKLKTISAKHVLVVSDSCYSGKFARGVEKITLDGEQGFFGRMARKKARTVMTSGGLEPVLDGGGKRGLSVFAAAFIDALKEADDVVDTTTLFAGIRNKVILNSDQTPEYSNIRKADHNGGDFLFVRQ